MKIVLINNLFGKNTRGGAEEIVRILKDELLTQGHKVEVVQFFAPNIYPIIDSYKYSFPVRFFWHIIDTFNIFSYFKIKKILQESRPDIVWTHNLKGIGLLTPRAIRARSIYHVHVLHDVQLVEPSGILLYNNRNLNKLNLVYEKITKILFGSPDLVVSPSQWLMNFYKNRGFFKRSKKIVLRNPISISDSQKYHKEISSKNFLYVGQIEEHKGIFLLVDAFSEFVQDNKTAHLDIIGSGSQEERLKQNIKNIPNIQFHGRKSHDEIIKYYARADYTVFPTLCYENAPNVIQESLLAATPVIASELGSISEFIEEGKNGILFKVGDKVALINAFEKAINMDFTNIHTLAITPKEYIKKIFCYISKFDNFVI